VQESEKDLVQRAIKRDRTAFTALYDCYVDRIYRHVYYKVSNQTEAEDITQDTFVKAWKGIDKYRITGAPFASWLFTISHNLIVDYYKKRPQRENLDELDEDLLSNPDSDPEGLAEDNLNREIIKQAVLKLKGDKQQVIMMRFIDGFSYEEIARTLHKNEGAVRVIQYRALIELRQLLKRD
jgi:RNA polymerase sigma-70 factor (ECF subfamily)